MARRVLCGAEKHRTLIVLCVILAAILSLSFAFYLAVHQLAGSYQFLGFSTFGFIWAGVVATVDRIEPAAISQLLWCKKPKHEVGDADSTDRKHRVA